MNSNYSLIQHELAFTAKMECVRIIIDRKRVKIKRGKIYVYKSKGKQICEVT